MVVIDSLALGAATIQISGAFPRTPPPRTSISQIAYINLVFFRIAIIFYTTTCEEVEKSGVKKRAGRLEEVGRGEKSEGRQEEETR